MGIFIYLSIGFIVSHVNHSEQSWKEDGEMARHKNFSPYLQEGYRSPEERMPGLDLHQ